MPSRAKPPQPRPNPNPRRDLERAPAIVVCHPIGLTDAERAVPYADTSGTNRPVAERLQSHLRELMDEDRRVFELYLLDSLPAEAVAEKLGLPVNAVRSILGGIVDRVRCAVEPPAAG